MGYEIDFLPVGDESSGGDAIALRYGNLHGQRSEQTVIVIDGGYLDDGEALVKHIEEYYQTSEIDIVVSTHPDQDHISGLRIVLERMQVGVLLMHLPWEHSASMARAKALSFKTSTLSEKLRKTLQGAADLEEIARAQGVEIVEPFTGIETPDGAFRILGPTEDYYRSLLPEIIGESGWTQKSAISLIESVRKLLSGLIPETLHTETLREDGETSPKNNSSAVCLLTVDGHKSLFTGDAGIPALAQVLDMLENEGFQPGTLEFVQAPHHGSRRNVSPSILNRLLGQKGQQSKIGTSFVSTPRKNPDHKHPAKKVTNAFLRRGYPVHATQGTAKWHRHDAPNRSSYTTSTPIPLHEMVEEDGD